MKSIRSWIVLLINSLVIVLVVVLSVFSFREFKNALDERVLLQLNSIKGLKRIQLEAYLRAEMQAFFTPNSNLYADKSDPFTGIPANVDLSCLKNKIKLTGSTNSLVDFTSCVSNGEVMLAMVILVENEISQFKLISTNNIHEILLERTGMGESGETYLVGSDFKMRSVSRFFPEKPPGQITVKTKGAEAALAGSNGSGIFEDYRGIPVYSSYQKLEIPHLNWAILSEIDVEEVTAPLTEMRNKLILISVLVLLFALTFSFFISIILSKPLLKMRLFLNSMTRGHYDFKITNSYPTTEINDMFVALEKLQNSIRQAIHFSSEIGNMNMNAKYQLFEEGDLLGKSLIIMQNKLMDFENSEKRNRLMAKRSLIEGQENERKRLSKDLHDGLGPLLTSLKLMVQDSALSSSDKKRINTHVDETISEIRRMTYNLMPSVLVDFGVGRALQSFIEVIKKSSGIEIVYEDATLGKAGKLTVDIDICLYRVCQELVNNSLKHASAKKITISLTEFGDKVSLYYVDDGNGFNLQSVKLGSGLKNIKERVEILNGYLNIISGANGTVVEVEIPFEDE